LGGAAGPLAQTVVAPDAATDGVVSEADASIVQIAWFAIDPDRLPYFVYNTFVFSKGKGDCFLSICPFLIGC